MDAAIERIFDPNAYLSHIAPLESTTAAIRIAARDSQVMVRAADPPRHICPRHGSSLPVPLCTPHPLCISHALSNESCRIPSLLPRLSQPASATVHPHKRRLSSRATAEGNGGQRQPPSPQRCRVPK
jgi:hypothetical protein